MRCLRTLVALQTFEAISDPSWKYACVICGTVNSIPWKTGIRLVDRTQLLLGTGSNHRNWSHFRFSPEWTPSLRPRVNSLGSPQSDFPGFSQEWTLPVQPRMKTLGLTQSKVTPPVQPKVNSPGLNHGNPVVVTVYAVFGSMINSLRYTPRICDMDPNMSH